MSYQKQKGTSFLFKLLMNKKLLLTNYLILLFSFNLFSSTTDSLQTFLATYEMLESEYVYEKGERSFQGTTALELTSRLTESQLTSLQFSNNILVRCYTFKQLTLNNSSKVIAILHNHLNSRLELERIDGCIISTQLLIEYFLEQCFTNCNSSIRTEAFHLLHSFNKIDLLSDYLLARVPINEQNYSIIEKAILKGNNKFLYLFLSYRKGDFDKMILQASQNDSLKINSINLFKFLRSDELLKDLSFAYLEQDDRLNQLRRERTFLELLKLKKYALIGLYKDKPEYQKPLYIALYKTCTMPILRLEIEEKYPSFTERMRNYIDNESYFVE